MSEMELGQNTIAQRYGGVLHSLAQENDSLADTIRDVSRLHECLAQEPREWAQITSPTTPIKLQYQLTTRLATSLGLSELITQFLKVICHNRRLDALSSILENFKNRYRESLEGVVDTATPLTQSDINHLQKILKPYFGTPVTLQQRLQENLLGGIILRVGNLMIDASLKTKLNKLHQKIKG